MWWFLRKYTLDINSFFFGLIGVINVVFLSIFSISLYSLLCRLDLSIFLGQINFNIGTNYHYFVKEVYSYELTNITTFYSECLWILSINYDQIIYNTISSINILNYSFRFFFIEYSNTFSSLVSNYSMILEVKFFTKVHSITSISFFCLQDNVFISSNETTLIFFRIFTDTEKDISCIIVFLVSPLNLMPALSKLQCFCFDNLFFSKNESLDLPVIFIIDFNFVLSFTNKLSFLFFYLLLEK